MVDILPTFNSVVEGNEGILVTVLLAVLSAISYIIVNALKSYFDTKIKQQNEKILCPQHSDDENKTKVYDSEGRALDTLEDRLYNYMDKSVNTVTNELDDIKEDIKEIKSDAKQLSRDFTDHIIISAEESSLLKSLTKDQDNINRNKRNKVNRTRTRRNTIKDDNKSKSRRR